MEREIVRERKRERLIEEEGVKIKLVVLKAQHISREEVINNYITYTILVLIYLAIS